MWNRTLNEDELKRRVADLAGQDTGAVLALYRQMHPGMNPAELLIEITTDARFWVRSVLLAERKAAKGKAPVYMYSFNWQTPVLDGKLMSQHALDVPFVFDTLDATGIYRSLAGRPGDRGDGIGHLGRLCPHRHARQQADPALARLYGSRSRDNDDRYRMAGAERSPARGAVVMDQDRAGVSRGSSARGYQDRRAEFHDGAPLNASVAYEVKLQRAGIVEAADSISARVMPARLGPSAVSTKNDAYWRLWKITGRAV